MDAQQHSILEHLYELRRRLLYSFAALLLGFFVSFYFANDIFNFLTHPLLQVFGDTEGRRLIYTGLAEKFFTNIKLAFFASFMVMFPVLLMQIWMFIAPALYKNERKIFLPFLVMTPVLFALGAAFVYYAVLPIAWGFFLGFEQVGTSSVLAVELESKVDEYLSLVMRLIFAFGFAFELPVLLLLLVQAGIIDTAWLRSKRRYAILFAFIAAAILTPPDPLSQFGLAIPLIILYEVSIMMSLFLKSQNPTDVTATDKE